MDNKDFSRQSMDDIVFDNRNKTYGAYALRESYQTHLLKAIGLTFGLFILGAFSPKIAGAMGLLKEKTKTVDSTIVIITEIIPDKPAIETKIDPPDEQVKTPPASPTEKFVEYQAVKRDEAETTARNEDLQGKNIDFTKRDGDSSNYVLEIPIITDPVIEIPKENPTEYINVDQKPEFIGGSQAMIEFIRAALVYPADDVINGIEGEATVNFVVDIHGNIEKVSVSRSSGYVTLDKEALTVVKKMSKHFKPGRINGKPVKTVCSIPIEFTIEQE